MKIVECHNVKYYAARIGFVSDIRLILIGSIMIVAGFFVGGIATSEYFQYSTQESAFGDCYDYSSGVAVHVNCTQKELDGLLYLTLSIGMIGGGAVIIVKGIRSRWDQNVKNDEMVKPKGG